MVFHDAHRMGSVIIRHDETEADSSHQKLVDEEMNSVRLVHLGYASTFCVTILSCWEMENIYFLC